MGTRLWGPDEESLDKYLPVQCEATQGQYVKCTCIGAVRRSLRSMSLTPAKWDDLVESGWSYL